MTSRGAAEITEEGELAAVDAALEEFDQRGNIAA
jgi:hypothetical protein